MAVLLACYAYPQMPLAFVWAPIALTGDARLASLGRSSASASSSNEYTAAAVCVICRQISFVCTNLHCSWVSADRGSCLSL